MKTNSCLRCKWLFLRDTGYSNYTVTDTYMYCVQKRNPELPAPIPDELRKPIKIEPKPGSLERAAWVDELIPPSQDRWHATKNRRCELYEQTDGRSHKHIDCDGDDLVTREEGERILLETGDVMPLLISLYFSEGN